MSIKWKKVTAVTGNHWWKGNTKRLRVFPFNGAWWWTAIAEPLHGPYVDEDTALRAAESDCQTEMMEDIEP